MIHSLEEKIEKYRRLMIISAETNGMSSPTTIKISQRLDKLINEAINKKCHPTG